MEKFNEEYKKGFEDGKSDAIKKLKENAKFNSIKNEVIKLAKQAGFSVEEDFKGGLRNATCTLIAGHYFDLMFNEDKYIINIPEHEDASLDILKKEINSLEKITKILKK